jgi:hypothetical protein
LVVEEVGGASLDSRVARPGFRRSRKALEQLQLIVVRET